MTDFKTILLKDSRLADITDNLTFAVQSGAANTTYQQFTAVSTSNSSATFTIQIPSESIVINRELLISTGITFTLTIPAVAAGATALTWGSNAALQAFPFNKLITTATATINNTTVSINEQDVLDCLLRFNDSRELYRYNSTTPTLPDQAYYNYSDAIGANNNPLASWANQSYDLDQAPRGAFPVNIQAFNSADNYTSPVSTLVNGTSGTLTYKLVISAVVTEPLFLSPFIFGNPEYNIGGIAGVNTINFVFNIDSAAKRIMSLSGVAGVSGIGGGNASIVLGSSVATYTGATGSSAGTYTNPFQGGNTRMLFNFLSTQASDLIPSRNVSPYMDYPRYLSQSTLSSAITTGSSASITSQNIQLNQLPDYFIIVVRKPMSQQTPYDSASFLTINSISINLNNQSGLLSSATQQDLWRISVNNNSTQSWLGFSGRANALPVTGLPVTGGVATTGSILVLNPAKDLSLPDYLSCSSIGQFNFQFTINVTNNSGVSITPEILVITANSGIFVTQAGSSVIYTGILTKQMVVDTKAEKSADPVQSAEYNRMVGGKLHHMSSGVVKRMAQHLGKKLHFNHHASGGANSGGKMGKYC
jgi:hypothetical protein